MKGRVSVLAVVLAAAIAAAAGGAVAGSSAGAAPLSLAVIGDVPYGDAQLAAFPSWIEAINEAPRVDAVVHLGDIKSGSTRCDDAYFETIAGLFGTFDDPVVYTPGDNEWTDCHRPNNGGYDPLERLERLREVFFAQPGKTLGGRQKTVASQAGYPENVLWGQARAVFAAVHVIGSNNSLALWTGQTSPTPAQSAEAEARIAAAIEWLDAAFDLAERTHARGVVLMMQADTFEGDNETLAGFAPILARLEQRAAALEGPVLLLQGDSHSYLEDQPLAGAPNLTRIVVEGSATASEWLRIDIRPGGRAFFTWERIGL